MFNRKLLVSGAEYFGVVPINAITDDSRPPDTQAAVKEHKQLVEAYKAAGIQVVQVSAVPGLQDYVFVANHGLVKDGKVVPAKLPGDHIEPERARKLEEPHARRNFEQLGLDIVDLPESVQHFSGQGDALPYGDSLLLGSWYRTDAGREIEEFLARTLGWKVVRLQMMPEFMPNENIRLNQRTGLPESKFYDLDLAIAPIIPGELLAWCPEAMSEESREAVRALPGDKIEVSLREAITHTALNLVSTGTHVVVSSDAENLREELERRGLRTIGAYLPEIRKGGGNIRCCSLTLDN